MDSYETITDAITALREKGYTSDFNLENSAIVCRTTNSSFFANEFVVDAVFRFEGMTDPGDEMILYAISTTNSELKGVLLNGYGIYSDSITDEIQQKLQYRV